MSIARRIFFSTPITASRDDQDIGLSDAQHQLIEGLATKVNELGYVVEVFARLGITDSPAATSMWSFEEVDRVMRQCVGAVFMGLPRWIFTTPGSEARLATEFSYYEAGAAMTLGLPRLVLVEEGLRPRVIFDWKLQYITIFPENAGASWLESPEFQHAWQGWKQRLDQRRDLFLGYSGKSGGLAKNVKQYLQLLGVTVLDWKTDFVPGSTILEQIQETAARCSGGIFLFTKDDQLAGEGELAAPRDNVVFEAGYFAAVRGKQRVLIIREKGSKLPADLGGDIYAALDDRADITPIQDDIRKFVEHRL